MVIIILSPQLIISVVAWISDENDNGLVTENSFQCVRLVGTVGLRLNRPIIGTTQALAAFDARRVIWLDRLD